MLTERFKDGILLFEVYFKIIRKECGWVYSWIKTCYEFIIAEARCYVYYIILSSFVFVWNF